MAAVMIGACQGCGACLLTCPTHAIRPAGGRLYVRDDLCTGCGECVEICPVAAIDFTDSMDGVHRADGVDGVHSADSVGGVHRANSEEGT